MILKLDGGDLDPSMGDIIDGDWVDVSVLRNGVRFTICRGIVDSVRESKTSVTGATVKTVTVNGRDHGA
ncbi:MAG: hypothetical protein KAI47_26220, partial [Deltaproteobacteria bacterium]|nr:hypothetical protein [Deltaproteobacteria bacterium]